MRITVSRYLVCAIFVASVIAPTVVAAERVEKGNLVIDGIPEIPERVSQRLNQYRNTRSAGLAGWLPDGESEQIVVAVRENGGTVWYLLAKDEGHGFRKKSNRDYLSDATALFLETFLLGE